MLSKRMTTFDTSLAGRMSGPSVGSGPRAPRKNKQISGIIDLSTDDESSVAGEPTMKKTADVMDLTDNTPSPSPSARSPQPTFRPAPKVRTPRAMSPPLPPLERDPPSVPQRRLQGGSSAAKKSSTPQIKMSPGSFRRQQKTTPSTPPSRRQTPKETPSRYQPRVDSVDEDSREDEVLLSRNPQLARPRVSRPAPPVPSQVVPDDDEDEEEEEEVLPASRRRHTHKRNVSKPSSPPNSDHGLNEDDLYMLQSDEELPNTPSRQLPLGKARKLTDSIGTSSPLFDRLRQQRSSKPVDKAAKNPSPVAAVFGGNLCERPPTVQQPTLEELQDSLVDFEEQMLADHALGMRWFLQDARESAAKKASSFYEAPFMEQGQSSPWVSLKGVQIGPNEVPTKSSHIDDMDSFITSKTGKLNKSRSRLKGTLITTGTPRVPKYNSYTNVIRNILTSDNEKLKFHPYLGGFLAQGAANKVMKELEDAYGAKHLESGRDLERASNVRSYLDTWLKELQLGFDQQQLTQYILKHDEDIEDLKLKNKPWNRTSILKLFGRPLSQKVENSAALFWEAFQNVFGFPLHDVVLPSELIIELLESARKSGSRTLEKLSCAQADRLETYTNLTCMLCGSIDCATHGEYQQSIADRVNNESEEDDENSVEREPEYIYERRGVYLEYDGMVRKHNLRKLNKPPDPDQEERSKRAPCSDDCYLHVEFAGLDNGAAELTQPEIEIVSQMAASLTSSTRSCNIAFTLGKPCWRVCNVIASLESPESDAQEVDSPRGRAKGPNWYDNKRRVLKGDWLDLTNVHLHQERGQANPCVHNGPCTIKCPCFTNNILCESFCGCSDDCPRKFTGCACLASGTSCVTESCLCIQMNRECGPQCGTCGALPRINPANRHNDDLFKTGCQNIVLQRGVDKKLVMGESQLEGAGFGLYVVESAQKGDYLSEYVGEVISSAEAERRGIIYDRKFLSFLFDLNAEYVIDATRFGNVTRFINHAESYVDGLNCEAKIVLVNGEHRIKFVALRDLKAGEELLFNYGNEFAKKHGLSKKLPKKGEKGRGEGSRGAVLVGEDALDALDGISDEKKRARGKIREAGKEGGRGKGKMRKSAIVPEPVEEDEDVEEEYNYKEDEEDDDEDLGGGRSRRKITRPARYTR